MVRALSSAGSRRAAESLFCYGGGIVEAKLMLEMVHVAIFFDDVRVNRKSSPSLRRKLELIAARRNDMHWFREGCVQRIFDFADLIQRVVGALDPYGPRPPLVPFIFVALLNLEV